MPIRRSSIGLDNLGYMGNPVNFALLEHSAAPARAASPRLREPKALNAPALA